MLDTVSTAHKGTFSESHPTPLIPFYLLESQLVTAIMPQFQASVISDIQIKTQF